MKKKLILILLLQQVFEETVTSGHRSNGAGTFNLDAPLGHNVRVVAHCADEADLDTIEVVSPSGRVYDLPLVSDGMLHIRIPHTDEVHARQIPYKHRFLRLRID